MISEGSRTQAERLRDERHGAARARRPST
jgi:hypothetical protein